MSGNATCGVVCRGRRRAVLSRVLSNSSIASCRMRSPLLLGAMPTRCSAPSCSRQAAKLLCICTSLSEMTSLAAPPLCAKFTRKPLASN
eukprot:5322700-Pyramimonas_sp.AAC.1